MKKLIVTICLILSGFILLPQSTSASHLVGGEIEYVYQGIPNTYLFRLKVYRDCSGIWLTQPQSLCVSSDTLNFSVILPLVLVSQTIVPNPPCVTLPPANCAGNGPGTEEYIFEAVYTLPNASTDWVFSWSDCCRNAALTTLMSNGIYVSATLDNINHPTDNSPVFNYIPYTVLCMGVPYFFDQGAVDPDGDSLIFSLVSAQDGLCQNPINVIYATNPLTNFPFSATEPFASSIPIIIDHHTGMMCCIPALQQVAVVCVLVSSYDTATGVLIGTSKSDIQVVITTQCSIVNPTFPPGPNSSTYLPIGDPTGQIQGPYYCGDNQFILPFSEAVQCNSITATDIRVLRSTGFPNPVISAVPITCTNGRTDSIQVTCLYPLTAGNNIITIKTGSDGNTLLSQCNSAMQPFHDTVAIIINDFSTWQPVVDSLGCVFNHKTVTFNEDIFCYTIANDGSDLLLKDATGTTITVSSAFGYCGPNGEQSNQVLMSFANMQTSSSTVYYLILQIGNDGNTIANECGRFLNVGDTLAIFYTNNEIDVDLGSDLSICNGDPVPVLSSGFTDPGLTYQWSFNSNNLSGATNPTYTANNGTGDYTLNIYVTSNAVCNGTDTVHLIMYPAPVVNINDTMGCIGSSIVLDAGSSGSGYHYQWYFNGNGLPPDTNQQLTVTQSGTYTVLVSVGNCFTYDSTLVSFYQTLAVPQFNNQHLSVCAGSALLPLDAGNPGLYYQWSVNGVHQAGDTLQTFLPSTSLAGVYTINVVVGAGSCISTGTMVLTVIDYPAFNNQNLSVCVGSALSPLDAGMPGLNYQWSVNGISQPADTLQTFLPSSDSTGTFNISVTMGTSTCSLTGSMTLTVADYPWLFVDDDHECEGNIYPTFNAGNIPGAAYEWQDINWTVVNNTNLFTPPSSLTEGDYYYYAIVTDNGCSYGQGVTFTVDPPCPLIVPNIITPNSDQINDAFIIGNIEKYPNNHMTILSRWGKEVYSNTYNNTTNVFKRTDLPEGLYIYMLELGDGKTEPITGTLMISK